MILPLGLNVRSAELSLKTVMLPPPVDALEREERRTTVWMAFYHDTVCLSNMRLGHQLMIRLEVQLLVGDLRCLSMNW
jgi:hypothetical protein